MVYETFFVKPKLEWKLNLDDFAFNLRKSHKLGLNMCALKSLVLENICLQWHKLMSVVLVNTVLSSGTG